jgi:tRNA (guanine37-N1)-methyltransferase
MREMAVGDGAILLCGRYEGIDQRFLDRHVDLELSLGDFVLSGGELPALALLDGVTRLQPGVLHDARSHEQDSFEDGLLDCPHYSRPEVLHTEAGDLPVPAVLLSGHHAQIERWRRERSLELTARRRPDLIQAARARGAQHGGRAFPGFTCVMMIGFSILCRATRPPYQWLTSSPKRWQDLSGETSWI